MKKVMVAMSGGVDSSVAALLLQKSGYDVIGATMQIWPDLSENDVEIEGGCCSLSAVEDARGVANKLGIPFYVLNYKDKFKKNVIDYFVKEYLAGKTPNPCIACNKYLKFDLFLDKAKQLDIDYIATGHHAKRVFDEKNGIYNLVKSHDVNKDQTYALYNFNQYQLSKTLLPIGDYEKSKVRDLAMELGLSVADKPDSQEICFVKDNNYSGFIETYTKRNLRNGGYFKDINGNVLGEHNGIHNYTIGQRKGLGITFGKPMFIVEIDNEENTIVLGENKDLFSTELIAVEVNYISGIIPKNKFNASSKIRYSAKAEESVVEPINSNSVKITFSKPQRAITPGQSAVFYDNDVVIGGGIISKTKNK
jgi:tRNA-specific 2-thiouridylase